MKKKKKGEDVKHRQPLEKNKNKIGNSPIS